jgi:N-acetylmuramoyl-L-alanine amidase
VRRLPGIVALAVLATLAPSAAADIRLPLRGTPGGWLTARVAVPDGTTTVGVRTGGSAVTTVEIAAGSGPFVPVHALGPHLTEPAFIGDARTVRVRLRGARSATLITIDAGPEGTATTHRRTARAPGEPGVPQPEIVSRSGWNADESLRDAQPVLFDRLGVVFVHHTVSANGYAKGDVAAMIRGIQRYHAVGRGWTDIGYNYLVDRFGRIYEGRAGGITANVRGAQVAGLNTGSAGIALLGSYVSEVPTAAQMAALASLVAWRLDIAHVDPEATSRLLSGGSDRFREGAVVSLDAISGHRDGGFTACPGDEAYRRLPTLRETVAAVPQLRIFDPVAGPAVLDPALPDRGRRFSARLSEPSPWMVTVTDEAGVSVWTAAGDGMAIDATWDGLRSDGTPAPPLAELTWTIAAGTARPAAGRFDDRGAAPIRDLVPEVTVAPAGGGDFDVVWRQLAPAKVAAAVFAADGSLVASVDAGTRREAGRRTLHLPAAALTSGRYEVRLRVARAQGIATATLPIVLRRGVRAVRLSARVVNAKGPSRLTLRLQRREAVPVVVRAAGAVVADRPAAPPGDVAVEIDTAALAEGNRSVSVRAETAGGTQLVIIGVLVDRTPPRLTGVSLRRGILSGRLSEKATLTAGGRTRTFPAGRFAWRVAAGRILRATDAAGNVAVRRVVRRSR